jgi:serine/threonine protein phosphatase 1
MPPHIPQTYAIADIHGSLKALKQCFSCSSFNYKKDTLIVLGDIVDGYPESMQVIDELKSISNLILILGNHDKWFLDFLQYSIASPHWLHQGGNSTLASYQTITSKKMVKKFKDHLKFLLQAKYFYIDENDRLFLHGGLNQDKLHLNDLSSLFWDRSAYYKHKDSNFINPNFKEIFCGHTSTSRSNTVPVRHGNLWNIDQGAGYEGRLTILNVNTKEFFQSDLSASLYPYFTFF